MHLLGIFVAAFACLTLGGFWFSPMLFGTVWARESGTSTEHNPDKMVQARWFVGVLVMFMLAAVAIDWVRTSTSGVGVGHGLVVGLVGGGVAVAVVGLDTLFERKRLALFLINAGYYVVSCCIMGAILSLM